MSDVTCVGLGLMGSALARALLGAGYRVTVWNRSAGKAAALGALGAEVAPSFAKALVASPVTLICIDTYASSLALLEGHAMSGRVIVNLTTGTPREAEELAAWVAARGGMYLDGAILCGPDQIVATEGEVLISGDAAAWQAAGALLTGLAGKVSYLGASVGAAAALDLAWLTMSYSQFIGVAHAANICRSQGIDLQHFIDLFPEDPIPADADAYTREPARIIKEDDFGRPTATLHVWGAALMRIQQQARDAGLPPDVPDFIASFFQRAEAMGLSQEEAIAIHKTLLTPDA